MIFEIKQITELNFLNYYLTEANDGVTGEVT